MRLRLVLLLLLPCAVATAQSPIRYRIETRTSASADMSGLLTKLPPEAIDMVKEMLGGSVDDAPMTATALVTMTTADSAGGVRVHLVIDSMSSEQFADLGRLEQKLSGPILEMVGSGKGGTIDLYILKGQHLNLRTSPSMNLQVTQVARLLTLISPNTPATARAGATWTDTAKKATPAAEDPDRLTITEKSPKMTVWRWIAPDTLQATLGSSSDVKGGADVTGTTSTTGKIVIVRDAAGFATSATDNHVEGVAVALGKDAGLSLTMKYEYSITITRLPGKP